MEVVFVVIYFIPQKTYCAMHVYFSQNRVKIRNFSHLKITKMHVKPHRNPMELHSLIKKTYNFDPIIIKLKDPAVMKQQLYF